MYKNLKIGTKLIVGFASLMLVCICMMAFALVCLNNIGSLSHQMFTGPYVSTTEAMGVRNDLNAMGKDLRSAILAKDLDPFREQIETAKEDVFRRIENLKTSFGGDKQLVTDLEASVTALGVERNRVMEALDAGDFQKATDLVLTSYYQAFGVASGKAEVLYEDANERGISFDAQSQASASSTMFFSLVLLGVSILVAFIMALLSTRSITRPMVEVTRAAKEMAKGSLNVQIDYESKDELGILAQSFRTIIVGISGIIKDIDYVLSAMGDGDFNVTTRAEEIYIGDYSPILLSIRNINTKLSETLLQINQSSEQVASGSEQVSSGAQALSQGATEQASSVEELAATVNEISQQIKETAENARRAKQLTDEAGVEVNTSNTQMQDLIAAMQEISASSGEIGKIIKTIEDIAFQTNILALNAAVEAARAGAAGKGFAVVADEVRNLASKSAEASKNTASLIESSIRSVESGTRIADSTAHSLHTVVDGTKKVVEIVDKITLATDQQATSVAQVTQGIDQISSVVQTNSATAEESAAASEELSGQAEMLKSLVGRFRLKNIAVASSAAPRAMESASVPQKFEDYSSKY